MEKYISVREWATVKRIAQSVQPMVQKKNNIKEKLAKLLEEYKMLNTQIEGFELGIKALCNGLTTEDLVHREINVVEGKFDKDGRPLKKTTFEPNDNISFDKEKNMYVITIPDEEEKKETPEESEEKPQTEETEDNNQNL